MPDAEGTSRSFGPSAGRKALPSGRWGRLAETAAVACALAGCLDGGPAASPDLDPPTAPLAEEAAVVLNAEDRSVTVVPLTRNDWESETVSLGDRGRPTALAVRGERAAVPLGHHPAVALLRLFPPRVEHTVPLPDGSGASGAAFVDDTLVVVGNPELGTVSVLDARQGVHRREIPVGGYPHRIVAGEDRVFVLSSELGADLQPRGNGTVHVLDSELLGVAETVELSGRRPWAGAARGGRLFVLNAGDFREGNGSLSLVDLETLAEEDHVEGFGDFPTALALGDRGEVFVASLEYGIAVWDRGGRHFRRPPARAAAPAGFPSISALAFDSGWNLYSLVPWCGGPGVLLQLDFELDVTRQVDVGVCPIGLAITDLP